MKLTDIVEDRIFLLNLKSRPDRLKRSKKEFETINIDKYTIFEAYGLDSIIPEQYVKRLEDYKNNNSNYKLRKVDEAIKISYVDIMRMAIENNYKNIMIFEDDFMFKDNYEETLSMALEQLVEREWDWFQLGGNYKYLDGCFNVGEKIKENVTTITSNLLKMNRVLTTHAQIVNNTVFEYIYNNMLESNRTIDGFLAFETQPKYNFYLCHPGVCTQRPDFSDLEEKFSDYTKYIN